VGRCCTQGSWAGMRALYCCVKLPRPRQTQHKPSRSTIPSLIAAEPVFRPPHTSHGFCASLCSALLVQLSGASVPEPQLVGSSAKASAMAMTFSTRRSTVRCNASATALPKQVRKQHRGDAADGDWGASGGGTSRSILAARSSWTQGGASIRALASQQPRGPAGCTITTLSLLNWAVAFDCSSAPQ
jgi:hypothetical protein